MSQRSVRPTPLASLCAIALLSACNQVPTSIVHESLDGQGTPYARLTVTMDPSLYSEGCHAFTISREGDVDHISQQNGTSDWVGLRIIPAIVGEIVVTVIAIAVSPITIPLEALLGEGEAELTFAERQAQPGCEGIFEQP